MVSWIDAFKQPIRDIERKYTISELVLMSWDARLKTYNMSMRYNSEKSTSDNKVASMPSRQASNPNGVVETETEYILPSNVNNGVPIPKKFFDEEGNIDLRRGTGPEVVTYLNKIGIRVTMPFGLK